LDNLISKEHNNIGYIYNIKEYIIAVLESPGLIDTFEIIDNVLKIKYASDGTPLTSKKIPSC